MSKESCHVLRVVHLSDFHFSETSKRDFELYCIRPLIQDLKKINIQKKIDMIIFSGDLIDKGGMSFGKGNIELAFLTFEDEVINPILEALELQKDQFVFVPGNHDIDRNADSLRLELGMSVDLDSVEKVNKYIDIDDLNDGAKRIVPYKDFERSYFSGMDHHIGNFFSSFKYNLNGIKLGVSCFNSSWRCWDSEKDKGKLFIGERQVANAIEALEECDIRIAVIHHPLDWLHECEKKEIELMIHKSYDIMLCGHVHEGESSYKTSMFGDKLFVSVAPANWSGGIRSLDSSYSNGYSYIDYGQEQMIISNRAYFHKKQSFSPNVNLGDDEGKSYYPVNREHTEENITNDLCTTIRNEQISQINEHLLSYRTNTLAPKEINELFVLPPLTVQVSKDITKTYSLDEICRLQSHTIFVGPKESGKTILLDKLLIEFTDKILKYNKLPVFIDLNISSIRIENEISRFLKLKLSEVEKLLLNQDFVLLVDQVNTSIKAKAKLKALNNFLEKYKRVRVIATASFLIGSEIPIELKEYSVLSKMFSININLFKSKQIRELTNNWFSKNPDYNNTNSLDEIVKIFNGLDIPRTPLAVSMFLCIFEVQPALVPINNSALLENFIEILFEKHAAQEIFSDEFNFKNKVRLVAEIAHSMYQKSEPKNRSSRAELISFIQEYMHTRRFNYRADDVLRGLEKVGLFTEEFENGNHYLFFRFNCFYSYFLMKNMMFNNEFKEIVISEQNYLHFIDEIDYYTGSKGDEESLLVEFTDRMKNKFEIILDTNASLKDLDIVHLNNNNLLTSSISEELLVRIENEDNKSDESVDKMYDSRLEMAPTLQYPNNNPEIELNSYQQLERALIIVAKVLKNTEETKDGDLKSTCYEELIHCAAIFISLLRILLEESKSKLEMNNNEVVYDENISYKEVNNFIIDYLPTGIQIMLNNFLSSPKLFLVMEDDVKRKLDDSSNYSELEIFISLFLYCDSKSSVNLKYVKKFVQSHRFEFIKENLLMKLLSNYFSRPKNSNQEKEYLNILGELGAKGQGHQMKNRYKTSTINAYKVQKDKALRNKEVRDELEI